MNTLPSFSLQAMAYEKSVRFDPIPSITPETLTQQLNQFRAGYLKSLALTMDVIEERDDLLAAVVPKAKSAPIIHGWEINTVNTRSPGEEEKARAQKVALEFFFNNLKASSAVERDLLGGTELFLEQMMDAKGKRYSVHNLVWKREGRGLYTCKAWHVPLWFFESKTGRLRFLEHPNAIDGVAMNSGAWMVTVGRGLMIACAVAWMYKRLPLRDWLIYCSRHGLPGFEGVTDSLPGTADYEKLATAVAAAANGEFAWIRSQNQQINKIDFGAEGDLPFPDLVDRMDRAMAAIWRGGDLSTMSKGNQAVGSDGQQGESEIIENGDAQWLTGQVGMRLSRLVLDYTFGEDEPELAYFIVKTPQRERVSIDLSIDSFALGNGHPISRKQFAERYNRPEPGEADELLAPMKQRIGVDAVNESLDEVINYPQDLLEASNRLIEVLSLENDDELDLALAAILPDQARKPNTVAHNELPRGELQSAVGPSSSIALSEKLGAGLRMAIGPIMRSFSRRNR